MPGTWARELGVGGLWAEGPWCQEHQARRKEFTRLVGLLQVPAPLRSSVKWGNRLCPCELLGLPAGAQQLIRVQEANQTKRKDWWTRSQ